MWLGATDGPQEGDWHWLEGGVEADQFWEGGHNGGTRANERVEHDIAFVGVEVDQPPRQVDGERCRVADFRGRLGIDPPHVSGDVDEFVIGDG